MTRSTKIAIVAAALGQCAIPGAARDRQFVNVANPVVLSRAECLQPYVAAYRTGGSVGRDVITTLEHNGCIQHLTGLYEIDTDAAGKADPDFAYATLRLNIAAMRANQPGYQVKDIARTPPIETGYVFRAQIERGR